MDDAPHHFIESNGSKAPVLSFSFTFDGTTSSKCASTRPSPTHAIAAVRAPIPVPELAPGVTGCFDRSFRPGTALAESVFSVSRLFLCRRLTLETELHFYLPLIEAEGDRPPVGALRFCRRKAARPLRSPNQTKKMGKAGFRKLPDRRPCHFLFGAEPLTKPFTGMSSCRKSPP